MTLKPSILRPRFLVAGIVIIGVLLSSWAFRYWREVDRQRSDAEFIRRADIRHLLVREFVRRYEVGLHALKVVFEVDGSSVTRGEFHRAAAEILGRYPDIAALEWVPVVSRADRAACEARLSRELGRPTQFTEQTSAGQLIRARDRPEHYAIFYVEPLAGNERAVGLDVLSAATRPFLEKARDTHSAVLSTQFDLVQGDRGVVLVWPVFTGAGSGTDNRLMGFVQGVFHPANVLGEIDQRYPTSTMDSLFIDLAAAGPQQRLLYYGTYHAPVPRAAWPDEAQFRSGFVRENIFEFGGRQWRSVYRPTHEWFASQSTSVPVLWLVGGLLVTALSTLLVDALLRRNAAIEREVTERTAELDESRRQLSSLLHALPGMAYRCRYNDRLHVVYVSEGALALTGYTAEELTAGTVHFRDLIHSDDTARVRAATRAALTTRTDLEVEYRLRHARGAEKWILSRGRGVYGADGRLLLFEGLAIDITDRKKAEAERIALEHKLLENQKFESIGLMAGSLAHNFNNLFTTILGNANLARLLLPPRSPGQRELAEVEATTKRAAELCRQMLAYAGQGNYIIEPVDLDVLIGDMLPLVEISLKPETHLKFQPARNLPAFRADAVQIRQLLMNLAVNASESLGGRAGEIVLATAAVRLEAGQLRTMIVGQELPPGDFVSLEVTDTGCGLAPEIVPKIFDPFYTTKFSGLGLGLAAVLGIVRSHAGALSVDSAPGRGSTFRVFFPVAGPPAG